VTSIAFHFHGYQPGDIVRWGDSDPLQRPSFEERRSPVSLTVGTERVSGKNWTDAVLRVYGRLQAVLDRASGAASVDIEPQTLVWLLERDPTAYRQVLASFERGTAALALTPPFHPILPHQYPFDREVLFEMMIDFHAPLLGRLPRADVGLWLPEAAYSKETMESYFAAVRRASVDHEGLPDLVRTTHVLVDARQFAGAPANPTWASLDPGVRMAAMGRDHGLSSDFAFGASHADAFYEAIAHVPRQEILVASDLESLLANPAQVERFESIVDTLRRKGMNVSPPAPPPKLPEASVVEYSSWSDYDEYLRDGHTSDTRWTGFRRADGVIVPRIHRGRRLSQLWKHAFTLTMERIETTVRRASRDILRRGGLVRPKEALRHLAVAYGRHLFREHFLACGYSGGELDLEGALGSILGGKVDVEVAGRVARGYVLMLMGLRSDPRFWDNPDTRVTFQSVALLSRSLMDLSEAWSRMGDPDESRRLVRVLRATCLEFADMYERRDFVALQGLEGWETTEAAWHESLQSEVAGRSHYDVVRRAALFALGESLPQRLEGLSGRREEVVADTGHIVGEAHGTWENPDWCEHRTP
jgi:hypothetical protein